MSKFLFLLEYNDYITSILNLEETKYTDEYIHKLFLDNTKNSKLLLKEGLIYSQPIDVTIRILKQRFQELDIEKYDDGDISIQGMNDRLEKYLPLINNLGYFISSAFNGDDNIDIKDNDISNIICDNIFIEPKYDYSVDIPKILYHASPIKFKDNILSKGLTPKSGNKLSSHPNRIYLTNNFQSCINFGEYLTTHNNEYYTNGYCIFIVKGDGIDKLYSDINMREGGFYTINNINKEYITLFKEVIK
jgi:hypothetical protein